MLRLLTLGRLVLEGSDFTAQKPLLLLCYLALSSVTVGSEIAERFWGGADKSPEKTKKSLETDLGTLRKLNPDLLVKPGRGEISSEVATDVHDLYEALAEADYPRVAELYQGPFLNGVERNNKVGLPASGELEEWIINKREELRSLVQEAMLRHAEATAREEDFKDAAELAWNAFRLDEAVTYPTLEDYRRIHTLLLAGGRTKEADAVRAGALEFSVEDELHLCSTPQEARHRLTSLATLPAPAEIFLGREVEVEQVLEKIRSPEVQIVTLVGPPGVGKTELASAVAHEARRRGHFARGLAFVSFDGVPDDTPTSSLIERMAVGLNLWLSGGSPGPEDLAHAIGDRETLLLLDNFEQLAPRAALLAELIERCSALTLLVTSRVVLAVEREHLVRIDGLAIPPERVDDAASYPSVQVFLAAARRRGGEPSEADLRHVARIARLVGGLPLALHLAAGWSQDLAPADIAERLESSLELLDGELRDVPERQRSLRSALDGSLALLTNSERALFRRLSVFREGFTLGSAETVAGARLAELHSLSSRSLLRFDAFEKRHRLHPLIRRYAAARLEAADEAGAIRDAHAKHYLAALQPMVDPDPKVRDAGPGRLRPEISNLVDAWRHAVGQGWHEEVEISAYPLERLLDLSGRYHLGVRLLEAAVEVAGAPKDGSLRAPLDASRAWLLMRRGQYQEALDLAESVLARLRASGSVTGFRGLRKALACLGASCDSLGRFPEAQNYLKEAVAIEPSEDSHKASALLNLGHINKTRGDLERAEELYREAARIYRSHDRRLGMISSSESLGELYLRLGKLSKAEDAAMRSLEMAQELFLPHWELQLYSLLGEIRLAQERLDDAMPYAAKAMEIARVVDSRERTLKVCCLHGQIAAQRGNAEAMWRNFREAWALAEKIGKLRQVWVLSRLLGALENLGEEAVVASVAGYLSTIENEAWVASDLREAIRSFLEKNEQLFSSWPEVWDAGRTAGLDDLVEDHLSQLLA